ncbi:MAG: hypothetical protein LUE15_08215 [Oscillospiraceae bacterium]|nr:hypothetical protein [Oscillospiraceae bacterium]
MLMKIFRQKARENRKKLKSFCAAAWLRLTEIMYFSTAQHMENVCGLRKIKNAAYYACFGDFTAFVRSHKARRFSINKLPKTKNAERKPKPNLIKIKLRL